MLALLENAMILAVVVSINAAIFVISPEMGVLALAITGPLTVVAILQRR